MTGTDSLPSNTISKQIFEIAIGQRNREINQLLPPNEPLTIEHIVGVTALSQYRQDLEALAKVGVSLNDFGIDPSKKTLTHDLAGLAAQRIVEDGKSNLPLRQAYRDAYTGQSDDDKKIPRPINGPPKTLESVLSERIGKSRCSQDGQFAGEYIVFGDETVIGGPNFASAVMAEVNRLKFRKGADRLKPAENDN